MYKLNLLQGLKDIDQQVALQIGGLAGIPTRDKRGNVTGALWVKYSEQSMVGMLLETSDIRKILLEQIQLQLAARKDLIQEMEQNEVVVKWLMAFTSSWEREYSNQIVSQYDIGQLILSAMSETYFEIISLLDHSRHFRKKNAHESIINSVRETVNVFTVEQEATQSQVDKAREDLATLEGRMTMRVGRLSKHVDEADRESAISFEKEEYDVSVRGLRKIIAEGQVKLDRKIHHGDDAAIRLFFRYPETRSLMCRVAGAILRKQEVCNRSGGYSAKVQRNDITQQKNEALDTFCAWVLRNDARLLEFVNVLANPDKMLYYIQDHKVSQEASDGMHFSHGLHDV